MAKITRIMVAPLAVNCYIIATEQHNAVAIDAGGSVPKILQFLQENGLTLKKILLIFCRVMWRRLLPVSGITLQGTIGNQSHGQYFWLGSRVLARQCFLPC